MSVNVMSPILPVLSVPPLPAAAPRVLGPPCVLGTADASDTAEATIPPRPTRCGMGAPAKSSHSAYCRRSRRLYHLSALLRTAAAKLHPALRGPGHIFAACTGLRILDRSDR